MKAEMNFKLCLFARETPQIYHTELVRHIVCIPTAGLLP